MVIVNKILNVLVFLMAIAACVAAVLLHERRIELRERADDMAEILGKVAEITDGNGDTKTELYAADQVNLKKLGWENYHHDRINEFKNWRENAKTIETKLEKLAAMKIDLADALIKVSENLEYTKPEGFRQALNSVNTYNEFTNQVNDQALRVRQRDDRLASALVQVSNAIKKSQEVSEFKVLSKNDNTETLDDNINTLVGKAGDLYSRAQLLANGLNDLSKSFTADLDGEVLFSPNWRGDEFKSESVDEINNAFAILQKDLKFLNGQLYKLKVANNTIEKQTVDLARKDKTIEELNDENDFLKNDNGRLRAEVRSLNKKLADLQPKEGHSPVQIAGKVVEVNDRYNFIVINRGKKDGLVLNANMVVHTDGKFICQVKVTRIFNDSAICEILAPSTRTVTTDNGIVPEIGASVITVNQ